MEGKKNIVHPYKVRGLDHGAYESPVPFVFLVAGQKLAFPSAEGEKFNKAQLQLHLLMVMDILWFPWPLRFWVSPLIWAPLLALFPFLLSCFFPPRGLRDKLIWLQSFRNASFHLITWCLPYEYLRNAKNLQFPFNAHFCQSYSTASKWKPRYLP